MRETPPAEQSINSIVENIHAIAAVHKPEGIKIGVVIQDFFEIKIAVDNLILTRADLYIDAFLLKKYVRQKKGKTQNENIKADINNTELTGDLTAKTVPKRGGFGKPAYASHSHKIDSDYSISDSSGSFEGESTSDYKSIDMTDDWGLTVGDRVALLPVLDAQKFIVLGKIFYMADLKSDDFRS